MTRLSPSSGFALLSHLLPSREKEGAESAVRPSPLVGEGARRAGEGDKRKVPARNKAFARTLRRNQTEHEAILWGLLRGRRFAGFKFRRQVPIGSYVADFVCFDRRLIVELDGSQHAENSRDMVRDAELSRRGFKVLRIWNNQLVLEREATLDAIWHSLNEQEPKR